MGAGTGAADMAAAVLAELAGDGSNLVRLVVHDGASQAKTAKAVDANDKSERLILTPC